MKPGGVLAIVRSWAGPIAAAIVLLSAAWLVAEYVHAVWVTPGEKALVESLKVRARTDVTIHARLLRPEFDRERLALERRLQIYRRAGLLLLISLGFFLAWTQWLRPPPDNWLRIPPVLVRCIESLTPAREPAVRPPESSKPKRRAIKVDAAAVPLKGLTRAQKALFHFHVIDACSGCTVCVQVCPADAIEARPYRQHEVIDGRCTRCGLCVPACPENAIEVTSDVVEPVRGGPVTPTVR